MIRLTKGKLQKVIKQHPTWTLNEIADELDVSKTTIRRCIKSFNIDYKNKRRGSL
ncbi:HTH transcriptional regulator [Bacillus phage PBS1]|uniref:HTH transcriptional regulator n=1 Tax=Bacillus phage PBS1 TaxID=2884423 RepID=A0A223LE28_BPPB1|nr:DNA binding protein [Bacillus phage PBS1]ASU00021.1 HTH transcriptional regulator [Bacillus phage PBS1]BDE75465.1 hypothetical protein [Bacillus phage PBS1]